MIQNCHAFANVDSQIEDQIWYLPLREPDHDQGKNPKQKKLKDNRELFDRPPGKATETVESIIEDEQKYNSLSNNRCHLHSSVLYE